MAAKTAGMVGMGRRLRELRERAGIPKEQVALALKMSAGNWAHYESGRNQLAVTMLPTIAAIYNISLENLLLELFELRGTAPARPSSATTRHPDSRSDPGVNDFYDKPVNCRDFEISPLTPRVLARV